MSKRIALVAVFMSIFTLQATGEVVLGTPQVFPHPMRINDHNMPYEGMLSVAPNRRQIAVIRRFDCDLYELNEENDRWLGPYKGNIGGFVGTRANPDILEPGTPEWIKRGKLPFFGWTVLPDGSQAFVTSPFFKRAIKLTGDVIEIVPSPLPVVYSRFDPVTGQTALVQHGTYAERVQWYTDLYARMKAKNARSRDSKTLGSSTESQVPDEVYETFSPSPDGIHILCQVEEGRSPLECLNTATGERVSLQPQNGRPRFIPGDEGGRFSDDGKYILMIYSYGPDDHYDGGYLQLFTLEGEFVMEISEFYHGIGGRIGYSSWLSNGWLVYSNGRELVFQKITFSE